MRNSTGLMSNPWLRLMRFDRPIGTLLLLWPTLWALWFAARGVPSLAVLAIFVAGVIVMRAAGCVINDYADRNIDPYVERTANRPLATGEIEPKHALILFAGLMVLAFSLVALTNRLTVMLAIAGAVFAATYPFAKRYTYLPQILLGVAFAWAIPMAYTAESGQIDTIAWVLFVATVLWTTAYDTVYAMVDRRDDIKIGVRSTAILFGDMDRIAVAILQFAALLALYLAGSKADFGIWYNVGLLIAALLTVWQLWLIRDAEPAACFRAFGNNAWLGMVVFVGLVIETWPQ